VHLDVANYGTTTFNGILDVSIYDLDGSFLFTIEEKINMTMPPSTHFIDGLTFSNPDLNVEPGTYLMAIQHKPTGSGWELTGSTNHQNPIFVTVQSKDLQADPYEPDNSPAQAYVLPVNYSGNNAIVNTQGSNCHAGEDYDFYRIDLDPGYTYTVTAELFDSHHPGSGQYSLDAIFSFTTDGENWSDAFEGLLVDPVIINNGGSVIFFVSPKFTGATGTYRLDIYVTKNPLGIHDADRAEMIRIYPNPARGFFIVDLSSFLGVAEQIQMVNGMGKSLTKLIPVDKINGVTVSSENLPEGIYFILIHTNIGTISKEIIIRK
jgi:hypothetical protein